VRLSKTSLAFGQLPSNIQALAKSLDHERLNSEKERRDAIANYYWQGGDGDTIPTQTPYGDQEGDVLMEEASFSPAHTPEQYQAHPDTADLVAPMNPNYLGSQATGHGMSEKKIHVDQSDQQSSQQYTSALQQSRSKGEGHGKRPYSQSNCDGCYSLRSKLENLQSLVNKHEKTLSVLVRKLDSFQNQMDERHLDSYRDPYPDRKRSRSDTSSSDLHRM
jgi:hypothetical protein